MQDLPAGRAPSVLETRFNESDIPRIRELIGSFLVTLKNHTLYPEDHVICRKSVAAVHARLDKFLAERDVLHLDVKEDRFLIEGSVAHQGTPQNDYLPFQLFRDGIQWLEFHQGLTEEELGAFFKLVIQYRTLKEEAEGDLVTALWEAGFPHLSYKKEEILWNAEPLVDFSLFKTGAGETRIEEDEERESSAPVHRIAAPVTDPAFWKITPDEDKTLREMVFEEETRDYTEDVLDVLTIILREQRDPDNFAVILDFLAEEFGYALVQGEFHFALKFLESLDALRQAVASETPWALELLEDFLKRISGPDVLGALEQAWPAVSVMDSDRRESLRQALLWFHPDVVFTLGPLLANTDLPMIEQLLTEIIGVHAERDLRPIAEMLDTAKEPVIRKLIPLLRKMSGQGPSDLLLSLTRHSSNSVCMDAIHALVTRDSQNLRKIFPMIQDSRPPVRSLILEYLGKRRNPLAEELLLHYFEKSGPHLKDRRHLLACYRALGQCGSARSIPFLQDTLLGRDWKLFMGMGNSVHRLGAALAAAVHAERKSREGIAGGCEPEFLPRHTGCIPPGRRGEETGKGGGPLTDDSRKDRNLRGEIFFRTLFRLLQTVKIHQSDNPLLLDLVREFVDVVLASGQQDSLTLQISRNQFYLQEEKFVCRTQNLTLMQEMLRYFQQRSLPGLRFHPSVREAAPEQIIAFAQMLNQAERLDEPLSWLQGQLQEGDYPWIEIVIEADPELPVEPSERGERGRWAYSHALTSIQEVAGKLTSQQRAGVHKAKRMVQNMVDLLSEDDSVLMGMSTIRDYDDYTYTHSVNVAILSMCLGKRIGLSRISMERLGICGLFHDIGKVEVPHELIIKPGKLTDDEYDHLKEHSINSVRQIVKLNAARDLKASVLLPPFEHHLKYDLSGYPQTHRKKPISLFGRILTITDVFDAMTSPRIYRPVAFSPDRVLSMMMEGAGTEFDPLILKVFIQMLGVYPVGTLLLLDTGEMGLVKGGSGDTEVGRPLIVLLKDNGRGGFRKGEAANLSETDPQTGAFRRNIERTLHPSALGIQPADFLV